MRSLTITEMIISDGFLFYCTFSNWNIYSLWTEWSVIWLYKKSSPFKWYPIQRHSDDIRTTDTDPANTQQRLLEEFTMLCWWKNAKISFLWNVHGENTNTQRVDILCKQIILARSLHLVPLYVKLQCFTVWIQYATQENLSSRTRKLMNNWRNLMIEYLYRFCWMRQFICTYLQVYNYILMFIHDHPQFNSRRVQLRHSIADGTNYKY